MKSKLLFLFLFVAILFFGRYGMGGLPAADSAIRQSQKYESFVPQKMTVSNGDGTSHYEYRLPLAPVSSEQHGPNNTYHRSPEEQQAYNQMQGYDESCSCFPEYNYSDGHDTYDTNTQQTILSPLQSIPGFMALASAGKWFFGILIVFRLFGIIGGKRKKS